MIDDVAAAVLYGTSSTTSHGKCQRRGEKKIASVRMIQHVNAVILLHDSQFMIHVFLFSKRDSKVL